MARTTRLVEFPGGVLELDSYGTPDDDYPGDREDRSEMRYRPTCLGYLRTDISGMSQLWDEGQIRKLAAGLGYDFALMVLFDPTSGRPPLARLKAQATRLDARAVIVPGPEHFTGCRVPESLMRQLDVITVHPEQTYSRYPGWDRRRA